MGRLSDPIELRLIKNDKAHQHRYEGVENPSASENGAEAPDFLSPRATTIFNNIVAKIEEMYAVSSSDVDMLVVYANNHEMMEHLEGILRTEGVTYSVMNRDDILIKPRPEVVMLNQCKALEVKLLSEFGLSPASRSKVKLKAKPDTKKDNPFAKLG